MSKEHPGPDLIPADFLAILRCVNDAHPRDDGILCIEDEMLVCTVCSYAYQVEDGIPNMLWDEAIAPSDSASDIS